MHNQNEIVLSTRVRLARNLGDFPFPAKLDETGRAKVCEAIRAASKDFDHFQWIDMADLSQLSAVSLAERRLVSEAFAARVPGTALLLREDNRASVMLCEEDHLRLQAYSPGLALEETYTIIDELDTALSGKLGYAFDERLGYLTQCPTNLGTAMRASVLLHLPALAAMGRVGRLGESTAKLGLTIRGAFGEGSEAEGALFQLSNQVTLGISERQAIENLHAITLQIAEQEGRAQAELLQRPEWENKIWRAWGLLLYARFLESIEAVKLLSYARMGAVRGLLPVDTQTIDQLLTDIQPATLSLSQNLADPAERDRARAALIRERLV